MVCVDHHLLSLKFALFVTIHEIVRIFTLFILIDVVDSAWLVVHHHDLLLRLTARIFSFSSFFVRIW